MWLELVETFKQIYPSISAETHVITNRETIKKMHYDFYLGNYNDLEETDVQYKKLMEPEKQFLIMNHKNPLSNKKMLDLEDLENEVFFSFSPEVDMAKHEVTEDLAKRLPYKMKLIEGDNLLRYKLLRENKCIALTTDVGMRVHYPSMEGLIAVPITGRIFPKTRMQVIAWPKQNKFSDAGRQFYEFVITSMLKKQEEAS